VESPARRLSRTPESPTLHQLHALSSNDRAATRLYLGRAIAQSQYYAAILGSRWPLLELVQTSLPDTTENTIKIGSKLTHKAVNTIVDTVFSRAMADAIDQSSLGTASSRRHTADRLRSCGANVGYNTCSNNHHQLVANHCNNTRRCKRCARAESRKQAEKLYLVTSHLLQRPRVGYGLRMLTVTIRNSGNIHGDLANLKTNIPKLLRSMFKSPFFAARSRYELGPDNQTVHAHILMYSQFVGQKLISEKWEELTGGSNVVDIRMVDTKTDKTLREACNEVCKYVTDLDKWVERWGIDEGCRRIADITLKLKGERFGEYYGNFRSQVFKKTFDYAMPKPKEHDPKLCKICGSAWSSYTEVFEPRGPPKLVLLHGGNNV
jgi:hypothetical protein